jgi:hypothetical protein
MEFREHVVDVPTRSTARIIIAGMRPIDCTATEISEQGATLKVVSVLGIPETFDLLIGTRRHECKVIQKTSNKLRVLFRY